MTTAEQTLAALVAAARDDIIAEIKKLIPTRESPWMTLAEAAVYARKNEKTLRTALLADLCHGSQNGTGGTWTVHVDALDAWLEAGAPVTRKTS